MTEPPIVYEQSTTASVDTVWQAMTDINLLPNWFFKEISQFQPEPGFESRFTVHFAGVDYEHVMTVKEVMPQAKLTVGWRYEGIPGDTELVWEVIGNDAGSTIRFSHYGTETFPQDNEAFTREAGQAGWDYFSNSLKQLVEG